MQKSGGECQGRDQNKRFRAKEKSSRPLAWGFTWGRIQGRAEKGVGITGERERGPAAGRELGDKKKESSNRRAGSKGGHEVPPLILPPGPVIRSSDKGSDWEDGTRSNKWGDQ